LIAAGLSVRPEVFREAFSGVTPARGRGPTREEARKNKAALLKVLAPQGVTNERLDEVSDYYALTKCRTTTVSALKRENCGRPRPPKDTPSSKMARSSELSSPSPAPAIALRQQSKWRVLRTLSSRRLSNSEKI
jgi:hypothetical protein